MTQMTEDQLRVITDGEMRTALGYYSGKLGIQRLKAMAYYLGEAKFDLAPSEVEGRSSVVSPDVRNTIESMLPQLQVKFCGGDEVVSFEPQKPGDEKKAEQATDYINHLFYTRNPGEQIAYTWMKDALLSKNGIVKVWWDERSEEKREEYKGMTDVNLAELMDDDEVEITEQKSYPDEEDAEHRADALKQMQAQLQQAMQAAQQGNQQAAQAAQQMQAQMAQISQQPPAMLYDIVCKRTRSPRVCVENVPPEEFMISRNAKTIADAKFHGQKIARTASELESLGYKDVDQIASDPGDSASMNMERIERLSYDDESAANGVDVMTTADPSQRIIWVTECWIRVDFDGDGIAELRRVLRAGNRILENEIVDCSPFVSITPVPMPHKFFGLSVADLAMEGMKINTALLRGGLDNMYLQVNGRYFAVDGQVNLDDLMTSRPGGVVRMKQAGMAGRLDQGTGDAAYLFQMMEHMKGFQEDSTGWTRYNQGSDGDSLNQTMGGLQNITNRADMRLDLIARNFAAGYRELFRLMLKLTSQHQKKEDVVRLRGEWVQVNPRDWAKGFDTTINVGLGTGNKDQTVNHLLALNQQQQLGLNIGTATPENVYNGQAELTKAMGFKSAEKFFTDPSKAPPQQPKPDPEQIKMQGQMQIEQMKAQMKAQTDTQAKQAEMELEHKRMQMQAEVDTHRQQVEAQQKALESQGMKELEQIKLQAQMQLEQFKAQMQQQTAIAVAKINAEAIVMRAQLQASATPATATPAQDSAADAAISDDA